MRQEHPSTAITQHCISGHTQCEKLIGKRLKILIYLLFIYVCMPLYYLCAGSWRLKSTTRAPCVDESLRFKEIMEPLVPTMRTTYTGKKTTTYFRGQDLTWIYYQYKNDQLCLPQMKNKIFIYKCALKSEQRIDLTKAEKYLHRNKAMKLYFMEKAIKTRPCSQLNRGHSDSNWHLLIESSKFTKCYRGF